MKKLKRYGLKILVIKGLRSTIKTKKSFIKKWIRSLKTPLLS